MILYYSPKTRAFPILWTLEELGAEYELKFLNLGAGEQKSDEYRRVNPMMKIPALVDKDTTITETRAILQYVAETVSDHELIPKQGDSRRAACLKWLFFVGSNLEPAMGERFQGWTPNPFYNGWGDFDRVRDVIAAGLNPGPWLLGSQFTVADIYLAADLRIARAGNLIAADLRPSAGYLERIEQRPSFVRALEIDSVE
jgi:glutathione S-transferase